jgi:predicted nucleic acid-binding protein
MEPSVLVKLFKSELGSDKMVSIVSKVDESRGWKAYTSMWSALEIARALRKDGKPREVIELDMKELRSHKIGFHPVDRKILAQAERLVSGSDLYASDAIHVATFTTLDSRFKLDGLLTDDRHMRRVEDVVKVIGINDIAL